MDVREKEQSFNCLLNDIQEGIEKVNYTIVNSVCLKGEHSTLDYYLIIMVFFVSIIKKNHSPSPTMFFFNIIRTTLPLTHLLVPLIFHYILFPAPPDIFLNSI